MSNGKVILVTDKIGSFGRRFLRMTLNRGVQEKVLYIKTMDIAQVTSHEIRAKKVDIRPSEKLHEQMIGVDDAENTFGYHGHYKILPAINDWNKDPERIKTGKKVDASFCYSSDNNSEWMSADELRSWINENKDVIGQF